MSILLPALAIAFAAFCVWLVVRIVNRRERWAKWTMAVAVVGVPVLYVLSFMVACGIVAHFPRNQNGDFPEVPRIYAPIGWTMDHSLKFRNAIRTYGNFFMPEKCVIRVPCGDKRYRLMYGTYIPVPAAIR